MDNYYKEKSDNMSGKINFAIGVLSTKDNMSANKTYRLLKQLADDSYKFNVLNDKDTKKLLNDINTIF